MRCTTMTAFVFLGHSRINKFGPQLHKKERRRGLRILSPGWRRRSVCPAIKRPTPYISGTRVLGFCVKSCDARRVKFHIPLGYARRGRIQGRTQSSTCPEHKKTETPSKKATHMARSRRCTALTKIPTRSIWCNQMKGQRRSDTANFERFVGKTILTKPKSMPSPETTTLGVPTNHHRQLRHETLTLNQD